MMLYLLQLFVHLNNNTESRTRYIVGKIKYIILWIKIVAQEKEMLF